MPSDSEPAPGVHPAWCVRHFCTANLGRAGAHRSRPIVVSEAPLRITAGLYAEAALPDDVLVEVHTDRVPLVRLPAVVAHHVGRALSSLGAAGEGICGVLVSLGASGHEP